MCKCRASDFKMFQGTLLALVDLRSRPIMISTRASRRDHHAAVEVNLNTVRSTYGSKDSPLVSRNVRHEFMMDLL